jgi:hypothetical protein
VNSVQSFTATVDFVESQAGPLLPMTVTWQATDLAPVVQMVSDSNEVSFTSSFSWTTPGSKNVSVSVANAEGEVSAQRSITTEAIFEGGHLQGRIFRDFNRNGQQESGEPGLAGVVVTLTPQDGRALASRVAALTSAHATVVTDEGGDYSLTALPFGTYGVTMDAPEGYVFLTAIPATVTIDREETITLPSRGVIYQIVLPSTKK